MLTTPPSQIAFLLSHLMSAVEQLEPIWAVAFLRRTRFNDADFQGGVLAVFSALFNLDNLNKWALTTHEQT
jgi:hypothetical protein